MLRPRRPDETPPDPLPDDEMPQDPLPDDETPPDPLPDSEKPRGPLRGDEKLQDPLRDAASKDTNPSLHPLHPKAPDPLPRLRAETPPLHLPAVTTRLPNESIGPQVFSRHRQP